MATLVIDQSPRTNDVVTALRRHLRTTELTVQHGPTGTRTRIHTDIEAAALFDAAALYLDPLGIAWDVAELAA
ncbi:hypothetical protein [Cellulomonas citrea]|uniref:hypothetical protein n=1 Tax=Cellulomonas citrea TaxID=1909423 RepID=UPI00135913B5|nr:hypothetical protein [Cellulomonas citrea]